jgi:hypothetical protein
MTTRRVALVCAVVLALASCGCSQKYTATSILEVNCRPLVNPPIPETAVDACLKKQMEMLTSRSVLTAALRNPEIVALPSVETHLQRGDAVEWLRDKLKIERLGKLDRIVVSCSMGDPHEAVALTNAVVDARMAEISNADKKRQDRLDEAESRVGKTEAELKAKLRFLDRIEAASTAKKAKASTSPGSSDTVALEADIQSLKRRLRDLDRERNLVIGETAVFERVEVVERAQEPICH